eukprot:750732-Prorocentrum_minimum.AAC.1
MDVLQQHPPAVLVELVQPLHGNGLLALPERDRGVLARLVRESQLTAELLHSGGDVHAGREEDEHRGPRGA